MIEIEIIKIVFCLLECISLFFLSKPHVAIFVSVTLIFAWYFGNVVMLFQTKKRKKHTTI